MHAPHRRLIHFIARPAIGLLGLALSQLAAPVAFAQESVTPAPATTPTTTTRLGGNAAGFGAAGQLVLTHELSFLFHRLDGGYSELLFRPSMDYFILPNVSVGGVLGLAYANPPVGDSATNLWLGVRAGYNLALTDALSLWPTLGVIYYSTDGPAENPVYARIYAPIMFHPVPHFFVGLGPYLEQGLSEGFTNIGIESVIGGYL